MAGHFDPQLIRAYDVNGPRYTSYPTANLFDEQFDASAYPAALAALAPDAPLSVYVHVPFCATICYYCACNKIVTNNRRHAVAYLEQLYREMRLVTGHLGRSQPVEQLHFGGGTPTYLSDGQLETLFHELGNRFNLESSDARDFSIEIDPRTVNPGRIRHLTALGINRISLGIQDFDPDVQLAVNRLQSEKDTGAIISAARQAGVRSVSVDLIYGLPLQTTNRFDRTLDRVIGLGPDRISLYGYAHLPARFKTQRQINAADLPDAETRLNLLTHAVARLTDAGYVHVGMDHFALPQDELVRALSSGGLHRNFQGYTTHGHCQLVGLGVSAISSIGVVYCQNSKTLAGYGAALDAGRLPTERGLVLSADDRMVRALIGTLMCRFELDRKAFEAAWSVDLEAAFPEAWQQLEKLSADGLVKVDQQAITVTEKGRFLIRNVCMIFDRYLPPQTAGFSKAI